MTKYRKLPVVIDAYQLGDPTDHVNSDGEWQDMAAPAWVTDAFPDTLDYEDGEWAVFTLEDGANRKAKHVASEGDWLIRGVAGELYFCKPDIFAATYELAAP